MNKLKLFSFAFLTIVLVLVICFGSKVAQATTMAAVPDVDQQLIKKVVNDYFDKRYQSQKNLQLSDFSSLIANSSTNDDLKKETRKLELEVYHSKVFQLQILQYQIYLDFGNMTYDPASLTATVNVTEGSDVIYAITAPIVSKARNINHFILLQKDNGIWKISADKYEDEFWKFLKGNSLTDVELRNQFDNSAKQFTKSMSALSSASPKTLQSENTCTYLCYDRQGAKNYADAHYNKSISNPDYSYIDGLDCTNFVSQAMFEGGGVSQVYDTAAFQNREYYQIKNGYPQGYYNGNGFYYWKFWVFYNGDWYHLFNHSTSWTQVDSLHTFLVPQPTDIHFHYLGGPIATDLDPNDISQLGIGDIIQFDWDGDRNWDHSVIISGIQGTLILVDAHSDDYLNKPLNWYVYTFNPVSIRYIHINDNLYRPFVYLPAIRGGKMVPQIAGSTAYPAPGQTTSSRLPAYPPPVQNNPAQPNRAYPAP